MATQTEILEAPARPVDLKPIQLQTPRDMMLLTNSIEDRVQTLKGLAKKNREEKYEKEARVMDADADALEHRVLPQVRHQQELPLTTVEELRTGICNGLRDIVKAHIVVRPAVADENRIQRNIATAIDDMLTKIAVRVESFAERVALDGYAAGYAAREAEPTVIAKRALSALFE